MSIESFGSLLLQMLRQMVNMCLVFISESTKHQDVTHDVEYSSDCVPQCGRKRTRISFACLKWRIALFEPYERWLYNALRLNEWGCSSVWLEQMWCIRGKSALGFVCRRSVHREKEISILYISPLHDERKRIWVFCLRLLAVQMKLNERWNWMSSNYIGCVHFEFLQVSWNKNTLRYLIALRDFGLGSCNIRIYEMAKKIYTVALMFKWDSNLFRFVKEKMHLFVPPTFGWSIVWRDSVAKIVYSGQRQCKYIVESRLIYQ